MVTDLVPTGEAVVEAEAEIAAKRGEADGVLVLLVEEIVGARIERKALDHVVMRGDVKARVTGVAGEAEAEKIGVRANAGEIAANGHAEAAIRGMQCERTGVRRPPQKAVPRNFRWVKGIRRLNHRTVVVGVIPRQIQPARKPGFSGEIDSSRAGTVGIEIISKERGCARNGDIAGCEGRAEGKTDDVVEVAGKVFGGQADAIVEQLLLDAGGPGLAGLGFQRWVAEVAEVVAVNLVETRLLDALPVENAIQRVAPKSLAVAQDQGCSNARNDARAEIGVGFGTPAEIERNAGMGAVAEIQKAALIVAASVGDVERGKEGVLDFVLIAGGDAEIGEQVACLSADICAVVLSTAVACEVAEVGGRDGCGIRLGTEGVGIGGEETLHGIEVVLASVGFATADFVVPVLAGRNIPSRAGTENVGGITLVQAGWLKHSLPGNAGRAGVVAESEAELVGVTEAEAESSGKRAIQKIIVRSLAIGPEVGCGGGIVECAEQSAELRATATRGEIAAFTKNAKLRNTGGAAMREELNDTRNGIGAVDGAFCAANDFHFFDVVEGEIGKIHCAAGRVNGRSVHKHFGEVRIAAVEKDRGSSSFGASAANGDARHKEESVRQGDRLPRVDLFLCNDGDGSSGLVRKHRFGLRGNDNAGGEALQVEIQVELALLIWGQIKNEITRNKWGAIERHMIAAGWKREAVGAIGGRICPEELSGCDTFQLCGDMHIPDARAAGIQKSAKQTSIG